MIRPSYSLSKLLVLMALQFTPIIFQITVLLIELAKANSNCFGPVCIPDSYDKTILPFHNETNYINVGFSYIRILQVDDEESTISLRLTLDMDWMDPRLNVEQSHHPDDFSIGNYTISRLNYAIEDKIWIPSPTIIDNGAELVGATGAMAPLVFWSRSQKKSRKVSKSKSRGLEWHQLFLPSFGANVHNHRCHSLLDRM